MTTNSETKPHDILRNYLSNNYVDGPDWNITGMGRDDKGKWRIPDKDYEKFLKLVHNTIFGAQPHACGLLERHLPHGAPIMVDLDFRYVAGAHLKRRFTTDHTRAFVLNYAMTLYRFFDMSSFNGKPLRFFVQLKTGPELGTYKTENGPIPAHKDGVHIICPDITLDPKVQFTLRGYLLQNNLVQDSFDGTDFLGKEADALDVAVISRNNWFLYGATKADKTYYEVVNIYTLPTTIDVAKIAEEARREALDTALEEEDVDDYQTSDLIKLLSIRVGHENLTPIKYNTDRKIEFDALMSMWGTGKSDPREDKRRESPHLGPMPASREPPPMSAETNDIVGGDDFDLAAIGGYTQDDIEQVYELVEKCLHPNKRAADYGSWVDLGICMFNISSDDKMLLKWAQFSRRADGCAATEMDVYQKKWRSFQNLPGLKKIRIGSLHFWANEDNPAKYKEITERTFVDWVLMNPDATHVKVATLVKRMYQYEFCCTMTGKKMLDYFQYAGNYWKKLKANNELRARLTNNVVKIYLAGNAEAGRKAAAFGGTMNEKDTPEQTRERGAKMLEKAKIILKSCMLLEGAPFKDHVMKECNEKFYDENFIDMLNQRKDIFACGNCVVELRHYPGGEIRAGIEPHINVRKGRPDDYISFAMGKEQDMAPINLDYDPKTGKLAPFDPTTPEQVEFADFFAKVFPKPDLREYVLTLLSSCMEGENREQKFYIMTGGGGNGKSVLINLMRFVFGEYQTSLNTAALTRRRPESGAANPDIITLKSKRFIYMQEPDEGEKLNTARIKQFTGGDIVEARGLFADQEKFKIMGRIFFSTNDLPPVNSMDGGTWRRIEVLPFESAFKEAGHPEIDPAKHVYVKDTNIEDRFKTPSMRAAFLRLLLHYWETRYLKHGLTRAPACVLEAINRYKSENDSFVAFANESLVKEVGSTASVSEITARYKQWQHTQPNGRRALKKPELIERLMKLFKTADGGKTFKDVRVTLEDEDISGNYIGGGGFQ
jgi:P4 family phage/plasmid primase-like protien